MSGHFQVSSVIINYLTGTHNDCLLLVNRPQLCSFITLFFSRILTLLQAAILVIFSPLGIMIITQVFYNIITGATTVNRLKFTEIMTNAQDSIIYSLIDHQVFNNYLISVVCMVLYPNWMMFWSLIWMNE